MQCFDPATGHIRLITVTSDFAFVDISVRSHPDNKSSLQEFIQTIDYSIEVSHECFIKGPTQKHWLQPDVNVVAITDWNRKFLENVTKQNDIRTVRIRILFVLKSKFWCRLKKQSHHNVWMLTSFRKCEKASVCLNIFQSCGIWNTAHYIAANHSANKTDKWLVDKFSFQICKTSDGKFV